MFEASAVEQEQWDEIYNLGSQSHVAVSFESPEYIANSDELGTLRILEAVRTLWNSEKPGFFRRVPVSLTACCSRFRRRRTACSLCATGNLTSLRFVVKLVS